MLICSHVTLLSSLQWRNNELDGVSNHQPHDCLLKRLFKRRSKKSSKLRVTGLYAGNSPVTNYFHVQITSNAENVSILWRHHIHSFLATRILCFLFNTSCHPAGITGAIILPHSRIQINFQIAATSLKSDVRQWYLAFKEPITWINFHPRHGWVTTSIIKFGMKLLIHPQT